MGYVIKIRRGRGYYLQEIARNEDGTYEVKMSRAIAVAKIYDKEKEADEDLIFALKVMRTYEAEVVQVESSPETAVQQSKEIKAFGVSGETQWRTSKHIKTEKDLAREKEIRERRNYERKLRETNRN